MTKFTANWRSYIVLGIFAGIFIGIPSAVIMMLIGTPTAVVAAFSGNLIVTVMTMVGLLIVSLMVVGWLLFRFVKHNKWG